jgi:phosphomannomutase
MKDSIKFGTDGWRGVIGDDFTFANVRRAAAAVAGYVRAKKQAERGLVVGYDTRFLSNEFARAAAEVIADAGIPVVLGEQPTPTPAVSLAVVERKAAGGVVITASHNPARWNGFKFKAPYGGSATPAITREIEKRLNSAARSTAARVSRPSGGQSSMGDRQSAIQLADFRRPYLDWLKTLVRLERVRASGRRFVVDPMFGAARGCLATLFSEAGIPFREIHGEENPLFPGLNPEPIEPHVAGLREAVAAGGYDAGFATDGDGDRLGAIDRTGAYVDSHKIFSILLAHLAGDLGMRGEVVKTFSTTSMVDKLAAKYGLRLHIRPIGFKHVGALMRERDILIGGEESGGIGIKGHLPERDGLLNSLLLAQVMAERGKTLGEMIEELSREFGPHVYGRVDLTVDKALAARAVAHAKHFRGKSIAGLRATRVETLDGTKLFFGDSAWLLVRASGTENLLRLYAEAPSREQVSGLLEEMIAFAKGSG